MSRYSTNRALNVSCEEARFRSIYHEAQSAGADAVRNLHVTPMIVGQAASLLDDTMDFSKPVHFVADGVCGFAGVAIKPATSRFAKWLLREQLAYKDSYYGGIYSSVHEYNQSYQKKCAHAAAMVNVFKKYQDELGIKDVHVRSRLD